MNIIKIKNKLKHVAKRARTQGTNFDLTVDWYVDRLGNGVCEVTGLPFDLRPYDVSKGVPPFVPTIDQIEPAKGYTKENSQLVIMMYNQAKGEHSHEYLMGWLNNFKLRYEK